jgi:GNAT superfamily N-acetyltransferase
MEREVESSSLATLMNPLHVSSEYIFRDVRAEDKAEVLAFTAKTWEFGDYIGYVFDEWLADPTGRFLAIEQRGSGQVVGIDKLTMLTPAEGWFEGLRIHPDFRGQGLATNVQRYMIGEAARLGARTIRFLTLANNRPIHLAAFRDGFVLRCTVRFWKWSTGEPSSKEAIKLRYATPAETPALHDWWQRSSAYRTWGLAHHRWSFASTSPQDWVQAAREQRLVVPLDTFVDADSLPTPSVLVRTDHDDEESITWGISAVTARHDEWLPLLTGLISAAKEAGVAEVNGLLPDMQEVYGAAQMAGFTPDPDEDRLCLFELIL